MRIIILNTHEFVNLWSIDYVTTMNYDSVECRVRTLLLLVPIIDLLLEENQYEIHR